MLNEREFDVLNILWKFKKPMTSTDIVNEMRGLTQSTVIAVLRKLLKNELVRVEGVTHSGKVLSRTYRPTEESREVLLNDFIELYQKFSAVVPADQLANEILKVGNVEKETVNEN